MSYRVDLGFLPADCPISNVITINEVITLSIILLFPIVSRSLISKEFPDIISDFAFLLKRLTTDIYEGVQLFISKTEPFESDW